MFSYKIVFSMNRKNNSKFVCLIHTGTILILSTDVYMLIFLQRINLTLSFYGYKVGKNRLYFVSKFKSEQLRKTKAHTKSLYPQTCIKTLLLRSCVDFMRSYGRQSCSSCSNESQVKGRSEKIACKKLGKKAKLMGEASGRSGLMEFD